MQRASATGPRRIADTMPATTVSPDAHAPVVSQLKLFEALATVSRAFAEGGVPALGEAEAGQTAEPAHAVGPSPAIEAMDGESRAVLGEAALAVAYGAFASRGAAEEGPMHMLLGAMGLMALQAGEEPDPPAEIMALAADDDRVEREIDAAGDAVDAEFGRDAAPGAPAAALEARLLGTAIVLAGCTLPEGVRGQAAVRLRAARMLARLAAGLMSMNVAGAPVPAPPSPAG